MKISRLSVVGVAALLAALVLSGCSAVRYTTTMKPAGDKGLQYGPVRFTMRSFNYEKPGVQPLPPLIEQKAKALYPGVFSDDWESLPVHVDIRRSDINPSGFAKFFTLTCTLGMIMIPETYKHDFTVRASILDSQGETLYEKEGTFGIDVVEWCSYWPWGLLPVPGFSDLERDSGASGNFMSMSEPSINKVNNHAAECVAEVVARSVKSADQAKLEAAYRERKSRMQQITVDGKQCTSFLSMAPVTKPKKGSTVSLLVFEDYPRQTAKLIDEAVVARYDESGRWQPVTGYLRHARKLTCVSPLMENGVPVKAVVRTPEAPPVEDFIDTPDLSAPGRAELLRWSNSLLLDAKNRSLDTLLREESRDTLLKLATRIERSILDLNEQAERAKDKAQAMVEKGEGDPAPERELSVLCRQRIEVLKPVLAAVKGAAAGKQ